MLLKVEVIDHRDQRYETCGDWQIDLDGTICVKVSDTGDRRSNLLVGIHETVEAMLCREHGVLEMDVDSFDINFDLSHKLDEEEPGEDPKAPYFKEHAIADVVERLLATQIGLPWRKHSDRVDSLYEQKVGDTK